MAANIGLRYVLTLCGMVEFVIPCLFKRQVQSSRILLDGYYTSLLLRVRFTRSRSGFLLRTLKHGIINKIRRPRSPLLELPFEVREQIYKAACTPYQDGTVKGALNLLLINKQIYHEVRPLFDQIAHTIQIGDLERYKANTIDYMGLPRLVTIDTQLDWHLGSLQHLVLVLSVVGISTMTPDCFDVLIAHNGKEQWRNLKRLIGIWPELRTEPLSSIRLDLQTSKHNASSKTYRADLIRVIRNFKRTRVWAETADGACSRHKQKQPNNKSKLLPLVRAFNQGRRNWVVESSVDNNLIVRYDKHVLSRSSVEADPDTPADADPSSSSSSEVTDEDEETKKEKFEAKFEREKRKWSIDPTDDTTRSDNSVWPQWTGREEKYIHDKMIPREREVDTEYECRECLAVFDKPGELREHIRRGLERH